MDNSIQDYLNSLHNSIEQKNKKYELDETEIMKMYKSTEPGMCEIEAKKLLFGASYENDMRVNGYHVVCNHCESVLCNFPCEKSMKFATMQAKTKHHYDHSCSLMKGKILIELKDDAVSCYNACQNFHFNRTYLKWKDYHKHNSKWHTQLKFLF